MASASVVFARAGIYTINFFEMIVGRKGAGIVRSCKPLLVFCQPNLV